MRKRYLRYILFFLGAAGLVAYLIIPNEKKTECLDNSSLSLRPYVDSASGVAFADVESFKFKCSLFNESGNCGVGLSFKDTENWNLMDSLVLEIQSSPDFKELVVQVLAIDPDYTKENDHSTMKPLMKELKLTPDKERYSIAMEHFYVPDYWFVQNNAKDTHNAKKFFAIAGIDIFSGWKNPTSTELELKINRICAEGVSNVPFVILVVYLGILIMIAIGIRIY